MNRPISRTHFLQMLGTGSLASVTALPLALQRLLSVRAPRRATLHDIEHVVILMQENRSFDHYLGTLRGIRGFDDPRPPILPSGRPVFYQPDPGNPAGYTLPFRLGGVSVAAGCLPDPEHSWISQHETWNGGKLDRWMVTHRDSDGLNAPAVMGYYTRADLPFHYALASAFTVCDMYFSSALGETAPNRLLAITGTIDPAGRAGGPVIGNGDLPKTPRLGWTTYPERLQKAGVSWQVYMPRRWSVDGLNVLQYFEPYSVRGSKLRARGTAGMKTLGDFLQDARKGQLPHVSWLDASDGASEHPSFSPAAGARYLYRVLEAIASNPRSWAKTVVFCTYDENGGFFDHVPPPVPPAGTAGEYVTAPLSPSAGGIAGPIGLGFRVPMIVISPWSRGGRVCNNVFDHTSILRFLERRFGVEEPNISAWRRKTCGDLTAALQLGHASLAFPALHNPGSSTPGTACTATPKPVPPTPQVVPHQESAPHRGHTAAVRNPSRSA